MWWRRKEGDFWLYTKYANRGMASMQFSKAGEAGELKESVGLDSVDIFAPARIVAATLNTAETKEGPSRSYPSSSEGPYKVFYSKLSNAKTRDDFVEHPESYESLGRATTIVKKYLRKHFGVVYIVKE
jgi:hypothetical protein